MDFYDETTICIATSSWSRSSSTLKKMFEILLNSYICNIFIASNGPKYFKIIINRKHVPVQKSFQKNGNLKFIVLIMQNWRPVFFSAILTLLCSGWQKFFTSNSFSYFSILKVIMRPFSSFKIVFVLHAFLNIIC